ncbi:hypothetical protein BC940DRAFT_308135 [Gongronella butleri]|nr:hypothetical protein BC940DRAFT_308135 [Gongronella butleri]
MGQTASTTSRHDNASTRTLHSSSTSNRPLSFFRRLSRRLPGHRARGRFGRRGHTAAPPSMSSSVRRATMAATHAAAAATGPHPSLTFLNVEPHPGGSSAASTTSAMSNSSDISQMISDVISAAVLSSIPSLQADPHFAQNGGIQIHDNSSFFRYMHMPLRTPAPPSNPHQPSPQPSSHSTNSYHSQQNQPQNPQNAQNTQSQTHRPSVVPILIVGYRTNASDAPPTTPNASYSSPTTPTPVSLATNMPMPPPPPPPHVLFQQQQQQQQQHHPHLRRRPQSAISTSSSLATLQSMPLSFQSSRTHTSHPLPRQDHGAPPPPPIPSSAAHYPSTSNASFSSSSVALHHPSSTSLPLRETLAPSSASSTHMNNNNSHHHHPIAPDSASTTSSSASSTHSHNTTATNTTTTGGRWLIYVWSGPHHALPLSRLSDEPTYEELLWLSSLLGPARPVTTTQQAIDAALPAQAWADEATKQAILQGTERCLVCLDDFAPKHQVRVLKCRHVFHVECVDRWLVESHNSCPVCRHVPVATSTTA